MMSTKRKLEVKKLPRYLLLHVRRFSKNNFFKEKNQTIVNFPLTKLDLSELVSSETATEYDLVANIIH
jgi:U4/U6.U5 tri-snRNP-associated protein 2